MGREGLLAPDLGQKGDREPGKDFARLWRIPLNNETEPSKVEVALRERIKELNCLYGIAQLAERHMDSLEDLLRDLVDFLPLSWQHPEIACARVVFGGTTYKSKGFKVSNWRQSSRIFMYGEAVGEVALFYLEECPPADEGPFLSEERALLDAVAERIGTIAARISAEQELQSTNKQLTVERKALQENNLALRAVLARIEEEKQEIYLNIQTNVDKILMPVLHALAVELPETQKKYVDILKRNLEEIVSPFVGRLSKTFLALTPTEISICNMIRSGLRTKDIARIRRVSVATVNRHREHIRRKLGIINSDVNLTTFLQANHWQEDKK
ncbi:MAG: helix-turn-helix transcriptional regulator [Proteobacteria bacterium]|nr:helix-turn-helix transcriptional regulator [Pseudomonadota bacterium]MBU1452913.1 helix-turn-helix transcriptional regulator [Pseudomonadota bacterium]MBU2468139.1 helix-turn-helix transcriptional regulator [Pseudomonadota bacterium]MBU2516546.1 helix-turn-helix transcriptional regulator [Pseudomonadota bacterium]